MFLRRLKDISTAIENNVSGIKTFGWNTRDTEPILLPAFLVDIQVATPRYIPAVEDITKISFEPTIHILFRLPKYIDDFDAAGNDTLIDEVFNILLDTTKYTFTDYERIDPLTVRILYDDHAGQTKAGIAARLKYQYRVDLN